MGLGVGLGEVGRRDALFHDDNIVVTLLHLDVLDILGGEIGDGTQHQQLHLVVLFEAHFKLLSVGVFQPTSFVYL